MKPLALGLIAGGALAAGLGFSGLRQSEADRPHGNAFAIERSGYGRTLARLSQDTVNTVWHMGVEGVAPHDHDESHGHGHDHDHGHDHSHGQQAKAARAETEEARLERLHDALHGREKGSGHQCSDSGCPLHAHGAGVGGVTITLADPITMSKDYLGKLSKSVRYGRNNPFGVSDAHRLTMAGDIEDMLLRAYRMDPSEYNVYNSYYLFLTINELRATPLARDQARRVSENTVGEAFALKDDANAWLTAAGAVLNVFFLDTEDAKVAGKELSVEAITEYKHKMGYCMQQYARHKKEAQADGRWQALSAELRAQNEERELFNERTFTQFDAILERRAAAMAGKTAPAVEGKEASASATASNKREPVDD